LRAKVPTRATDRPGAESRTLAGWVTSGRYAYAAKLASARPRPADLSLAQSLQRAVAELADPLTRHAEHRADLLEGVFLPVVESEVEPEDPRVARREGVERLAHFLGKEPVHGARLHVAVPSRHEPVDQGAVAARVEGGVEADIAGVQRHQRLHHLERELHLLRHLLGGRFAHQLLPEQLGGADDPGEVGGPVERHPHGAALLGDRGKDGLPDPPDGVGDELHADIGIEFPRGGEQADVPLADEVGQRHPPVLVFLGDGDDEPEVALHQLLHRLLVAGADPARNGDLLCGGQEGRLADLVQVLIEDLAFGRGAAEGPRGFPGTAGGAAGRGGRIALGVWFPGGLLDGHRGPAPRGEQGGDLLDSTTAFA